MLQLGRNGAAFLGIVAIAIIVSCGREKSDAPPKRAAPRPQPVSTQTIEQPMLVGGEVAPPVVQRKTTFDFEPCRKLGIYVQFFIIETTIDQQGRVGTVKFLKPVPPCAADAVQEALKQWRWKPGTYKGKPVTVTYNMTVALHYR